MLSTVIVILTAQIRWNRSDIVVYLATQKCTHQLLLCVPPRYEVSSAQSRPIFEQNRDAFLQQHGQSIRHEQRSTYYLQSRGRISYHPIKQE